VQQSSSAGHRRRETTSRRMAGRHHPLSHSKAPWQFRLRNRQSRSPHGRGGLADRLPVVSALPCHLLSQANNRHQGQTRLTQCWRWFQAPVQLYRKQAPGLTGSTNTHLRSNQSALKAPLSSTSEYERPRCTSSGVTSAPGSPRSGACHHRDCAKYPRHAKSARIVAECGAGKDSYVLGDDPCAIRRAANDDAGDVPLAHHAQVGARGPVDHTPCPDFPHRGHA
jgi:hypothetical protein